jgi:hypothetical protein
VYVFSIAKKRRGVIGICTLIFSIVTAKIPEMHWHHRDSLKCIKFKYSFALLTWYHLAPLDSLLHLPCYLLPFSSSTQLVRITPAQPDATMNPHGLVQRHLHQAWGRRCPSSTHERQPLMAPHATCRST